MTNPPTPQMPKPEAVLQQLAAKLDAAKFKFLGEYIKRVLANVVEDSDGSSG